MNNILLFQVFRFVEPSLWSILPHSVERDLISDSGGDKLVKEDIWLFDKCRLYTPFVYFYVYNRSGLEHEKTHNPLLRFLGCGDRESVNILNTISYITINRWLFNSTIAILDKSCETELYQFVRKEFFVVVQNNTGRVVAVFDIPRCLLVTTRSVDYRPIIDCLDPITFAYANIRSLDLSYLEDWS